jgi:hypothetical protein
MRRRLRNLVLVGEQEILRHVPGFAADCRQRYRDWLRDVSVVLECNGKAAFFSRLHR